MKRRAQRAVLGPLAAAVAFLAADSLLGHGYHESTSASVIVTRPSTPIVDEALVVFPGYASDGDVVSRAFAPYMRDGQAMIVVDYAQRGVDDAAIFRLTMEQVRTLAPRRLRVFGGSMGGVVATRFLARYATSPDRERFGPVVLVLDTAPAGMDTIKRPHWLFSLSAWYRGGPLTSTGWALLSRFGVRPSPELGANHEVIDEGDHRNAWVGVPALTTQAEYLGTFRPDEIPQIRGIVLRGAYLQAASAGDDPLVRVDSAIARWKAGLPTLTIVTIPGRRGSWHLPWTYRPRETLTAANVV